MAVTSGDHTVAASATVLTTSAATQSILLFALAANSGTTYVGGSNVTTSIGVPLAPGAALSFDVADTAQLYLIGTASDHVRWVATAK